MRSDSILSQVVDLGFMTRNYAELNLELNQMGDVWFKADGCGQLPGYDLTLGHIAGAPTILTRSIGVTYLWRKAHAIYLFRDHQRFVKYTQDERMVGRVDYYFLLQTPDMEAENAAFWYQWSEDGLLFRDTPDVARACVLENYRTLHNQLARAEFQSGATGFQEGEEPHLLPEEGGWEGFQDYDVPQGIDPESWFLDPFQTTTVAPLPAHPAGNLPG